MLGLILIYFIGKKFYQLADKYDKNKWGHAISGVITYYAGAFVFGMLIGVAIELWGSISVLEMNDMVLGLIAMPFGILSVFGLYVFLKKRYEKNASTMTDSIDDIGTV
jgi:uncharacterized membrane protein HdeD (DUF308 family)